MAIRVTRGKGSSAEDRGGITQSESAPDPVRSDRRFNHWCGPSSPMSSYLVNVAVEKEHKFVITTVPPLSTLKMILFSPFLTHSDLNGSMVQ